MVLVAQAIHALSPGGLSAESRSKRVLYHWLLVLVAVVSALLGKYWVCILLKLQLTWHWHAHVNSLVCLYIKLQFDNLIGYLPNETNILP